MVYSHVPEGKRKKLDNRAQKLRFIGYTDTARNYKVWDEETRRSYIRHDVIFNESDFGKPKQGVSTKPDEEKQAELELEVTTPEQSEEPPVQEESDEEEEQGVRRSQQVKKPVTRFGVDEYVDTSTVEAQHVAFRVSEIDEPTTIEEALSGDHSQQWKWQQMLNTSH